MKITKTILSLLFVVYFLIPSYLGSEVILRGSATANQIWGRSVTSTSISNVNQGDLITVVLRERDGNNVLSISDSVNGTWNLTNSLVVRNASGVESIYYYPNSNSGNLTVTVSYGTDSSFSFYVDVWSGLMTSGVLGSTNINNNSSRTSHSSGSITTDGAGLIISGLAHGSGESGNMTPGSGFVLTNSIPRNTRQYKISNSAETTTASVQTQNNFSTYGAIAFFRGVDSGGSQNPPPPPSDTTPPTVSLTQPTGGTVTGTVTVTANATDNVSVAGVQFLLDGVSLGAEDTTSPYSISWNTTTATNGTRTLTARARDTAGNTTTSSTVTVTVNNVATPPQDTTPPTISSISVSNITTTGATITYTTNETTTSQVQYGLSTSYGSVANSGGATSHSVIISNLQSNTVYNFRVSATDTSNNNSLSTNQTFTTAQVVSTPPNEPSAPPTGTPTPTGSGKYLYVSPTGDDSVTYANNNASNPWRTIGRAAWGSTNRSAPNSAQAAKAGDVVIVNAGTYTTTGLGNRWEVAYFTANSGQSGRPITFQANGTVNLVYSSGVGPVIGASAYVSGGFPRDYITWRGFTIDEALAPSASDTGPVVCVGVTGCVIEDNTIIGVLNKQRNDNYNGIRLEDAFDVVIRNNRIMNFQGSFGRNHAGIMTYYSGNILIENNEFSGVRSSNTGSGVGIYLKADFPNAGWITIRYNKFSNLQLQGIQIHREPATVSNPIKIYQNIFTGSDEGILINAFDEGSSDPRNVKVFNNTFVNNTRASFVTNRDMVPNSGHVFRNNIISGGQIGINIASTQINKSRFDSENNVVHNVGTFGYFGTTAYNLSSWQSQLGQDAATPASITSNPLFVSSTDFRLQASSPARTIGRAIYGVGGSDGTTIPAGAYITGNEIIGINTTGSSNPTPPPPPPPPSDTTPPTVSLTQPTGGTVTGTVTVIANATDNVSVAGVQFRINGVNHGNEDTTSPYTTTWNTTTLTNGTYTISAVARDSAGNTTTSSNITVTVNNTVTPPPTVSLSASPTSVVSGGSSTLTWSSTNTTSCTASGSWSGSKAVSGTQTISGITSNSTFTLSCTGAGGTTNQSVNVSATQPTTPTSTLFTIGQRVQTTANLNVRATPSSTGTLLGTQQQGSIGTITATSVYANNTHWWNVNYDNGADGWSAENFLSIYTPPANPSDTIPPVISSINVIDITATSTRVTWVTNEPATSRILYGTSQSYNMSSPINTNLTTNHDIILSGLRRRTTYNYQIVSVDASGNTSISSNQTFTTASRLPKTPKVTNVSASSGSVILSWGVPVDDDLVPYELFSGTLIMRSANSFIQTPNLSSALANLSSSVTTYTDTAVENGTTYYYTLFSYDDQGVYSDPVFISFTVGSSSTPTPTPPSTGSGGAPAPTTPTQPTPAVPTTPTTPTQPSTPTVNIPKPNLTRTIYIGTKGSDVTELQNFLISLGYLQSGLNTGYYGNSTKEAVQKYQCNYMQLCSGEESTTGYGMVGQKTRASISSTNTSSTPTLPTTPTTPTTLTPEQRAAIQKQINDLLILVQQLLIQLRAMQGN